MLISWCIYSYRIVMLLVPYMWASMTFLPTIGSTVAFVVFVYFYNTLNNYPVCCLHKLSLLYTLLFYLETKASYW